MATPTWCSWRSRPAWGSSAGASPAESRPGTKPTKRRPSPSYGSTMWLMSATTPSCRLKGGGGVLGAARRCMADPGFTWCCTWPSERTDVDLVPRQMRMAEDDDVGLREPAAETGASAGGRPAVVDGRNFTSVEVRDESLGQDHAAVVVAEDGSDGSELLQRRQHRRVGDVARMDDGIGRTRDGRRACRRAALRRPRADGCRRPAARSSRPLSHGSVIWPDRRTFVVGLQHAAGNHGDSTGRGRRWVAELECHHGQHVRHRPPFFERPGSSRAKVATSTSVRASTARCATT